MTGGGTVAVPRQRLTVLTSTMGGGGAQRSMVRLAGGLAERGYDVDLVLGRRDEDDHYRAEVADTVRIVSLDAPRALFSVPRLIRYLRRERPVAMVTSLDYMNVLGVWARWLARVDTRVVVNEQNTLSMVVDNGTRRRKRVLPWLVRQSYRRADGIAAVSEGVADDLARFVGLPRDRVDAIHNPVVVPQLADMTTQPLDHPWFGPDEPPVLLAVGRLTPQKDFETLLRAFAKVRASHAARLLVLGDGDERSRLEALVIELGLEQDVSLPGWAVNPYPYMAAADLFVLSSLWEGLPTVLIEALYCGVPIVATDCPSGPREILQGGRYGSLVPVGDVDALAQAIADALDGDVPAPVPESWAPYRIDVVTDRYLQLMLRE